LLEERNPKDIRYVNILKALAIIAVVVGHSDTPLVKIIYLYHMPLFFFISGYLYNDKYSLNPLKQIKNKILTLFIPFIKYEFIFLALNNIFVKLGIYTLVDAKVEGLAKGKLYSAADYIKVAKWIFSFENAMSLLGAFWFIPALFFTSILFSVIGFLVNKIQENNRERVRLLLLLILFFIGNYLTKIGTELPKFIGNVSLVALFIFYMGYMYRRYEDRIVMSYFYAGIGIVILYSSQFFGGVSMASNAYQSPSFLIVSTIAGVYVNIFFAKKIERLKVNKITSLIKNLLYYIGKNSFTIMALHFISFKVVSLIQIPIYGYPQYMLAKFPVIAGGDVWWIIYSFVGVFIPILFKYITDKLIFERKWVKK
jgi:fucose 4-O-acetylase-like acetyltransferase